MLDYCSSQMECDDVFAQWPNKLYYAATIQEVLQKHFLVCFSDGAVRKVSYMSM
jgi:hypothetical protein